MVKLLGVYGISEQDKSEGHNSVGVFSGIKGRCDCGDSVGGLSLASAEHKLETQLAVFLAVAHLCGSGWSDLRVAGGRRG